MSSGTRGRIAAARATLCLALVWPVAHAWPATAGCRAMTELTEADLATFQFQHDGTLWSELPRDRDYRLGTITVVRQDVFEDADNWLQETANRYHRRTREEVVLSVLPMSEGDRVGARLLAEAERILRRKVYLYDARVIPRRVCGDDLDIFVVTRDVWTLMPRASLSRTGSENEAGFGINDTNVLGSGQYVSLGYEKDKDRRGVTFEYGNPNVGHSRWALDLALVDNDDGERAAASLAYPFYALDTRRALSFEVDDFSRDEGLYFLGDEVWEYRADTYDIRLFTGWSPGLQGRSVNRLLFGWAHESYDFDLPGDLTAGFPDLDPGDREYSYPFVAFQRLEDNFDTRVNLDRVQHTEDVALGTELYVELGYSPEGAGSGEHLVGRVRYADAAWLAPDQLVSLTAWLDGYYDLEDHAGENLAAGGVASYRYRHAEDWSLLIRGSATAIRHPTLDQQLMLGGEQGLRGYPNRYQIGDRRFLLTVEELYYSDLYPLQIFRVGAAVFLDVGRAWYEGEAPDWVPESRRGDHFGMLANVGVGLRFESTRTRGDQIIHLDVAYPLRDGPGVRRVEVTLTAKATL